MRYNDNISRRKEQPGLVPTVDFYFKSYLNQNITKRPDRCTGVPTGGTAQPAVTDRSVTKEHRSYKALVFIRDSIEMS